MGRKESKAWDCIHSLCAAHQLEEQNLYKRARLLLSSYNSLCWSQPNEDMLSIDSLAVENALNLRLAFRYLREFPGTENKRDFAASVAKLLDLRVLQEIVNHTLLRVREFPVFGKVHFEILNKCYICSVEYHEDDILLALEIERSSYYDRKKEAIMLFGIVFWTTALQHYEELFKTLSVA